MITECSMSDNVAVEFPEVEFIRPCNLCPHMKRITLPKILRCLQTMQPEVTIEPDVAEKARRSVERMVELETVMTHPPCLCPDAFLSPLEIDAVVARALAEDLGRAGDVTSIATIPEDMTARAVVVARKAGSFPACRSSPRPSPGLRPRSRSRRLRATVPASRRRPRS